MCAAAPQRPDELLDVWKLRCVAVTRQGEAAADKERWTFREWAGGPLNFLSSASPTQTRWWLLRFTVLDSLV